MSERLVSVVVPMYNDRRTIDLCLRSIREQTHPHIEVIVVDDASTDGCAEIAATHPVQLVRVPRNGGPGSSRNEGVRRSKGEIVFFLDADLTMHPEAVAEAVALFDENPSYGAVFGIPDKEPLFEEPLVGQYRILQYYYWRKSAEGLVSGGFYALGAVRRSAFMEAGWFNTALRQTEEIDHAERLAARWPMLLTSRIRGRLSDESRMRPCCARPSSAAGSGCRSTSTGAVPCRAWRPGGVPSPPRSAVSPSRPCPSGSSSRPRSSSRWAPSPAPSSRTSGSTASRSASGAFSSRPSSPAPICW